MNVFEVRKKLIADYRKYVQSFVSVRDPRISEKVGAHFEEGELWPEPLLQLNPSFQPGLSVDDLVDSKVLTDKCSGVFRVGKGPKDTVGKTMRLHKHQEEAIRVASKGVSYVLTTGTGSGKSLTDPFVDIRGHALRYWAKMKEDVPTAMIVPFLDSAVDVKQSSIVLRVFSEGEPQPSKVDFLVARADVTDNQELRVALEEAAQRMVREGLIKRTIDKTWLKVSHPELYSKTSEKRVEYAIVAERERRRQSEIFDSDSDPLAYVDADETPEQTQETMEERALVHDMAGLDQKIIEKKVFVRNHAEVAEVVKERGRICQVCGINNIQVDVHHVEALRHGGEDVSSNMIVVCPNCHARFHMGQITRTSANSYELKLPNANRFQLDGILGTRERFKIMNDYFHQGMV